MRLGITLGDPAGVGPELLVRTLAAGLISDEVVIYGPQGALELACDRLSIPRSVLASHLVCDAMPMAAETIPIGQVDAKCGAVAVKALDCAIMDALAGDIDAMITLPINKQAARLTHPHFEGHTEHIAAACGVIDQSMMLLDHRLAVTHVSTHVSLAEAISRCQRERIETVIRLTHAALQPLLGHAPRIAVAALNPHAGEGGAFGTEEREHIAPAIDAARNDGFEVTGPWSPDTVFMHGLSGKYDAVVAMYHDQGHIPMKTGGFADTVNVTIGLPIVRVSVDHGTAFDIAYRGIADPANFMAALAQGRRLGAARLAQATAMSG
jgi:4-phospho-D-threonate 3-dehydrogenase / 4-phospho-D-erythronate 3-dehydrogenase